MQRITIQTLDTNHVKLINMFVDSIKTEYETKTSICIPQLNSKLNEPKTYSGYIMYKEKETHLQSIFNTKKSQYSVTEKEVFKCLTYAGQLIAKSFHAYCFEFNTNRDILLKELDSINKKALEDNAKYFILTQMTGD